MNEAVPLAVERGALAPRGDWRRAVVLLSDGLDWLTEAAYVAATAAFGAVMALGVFFRYVLNDSLAWSDELALIVFVWATFLSISTAYLHGKHVSITAAVKALPDPWRQRAEALAEGLGGAYLACLLVSGVQALAIAARAHTTALQWPLTVPYLAIPVAAVLMLIHWLRRNLAEEGSAWALAFKLAVTLAVLGLCLLPLGSYVALSGQLRFWSLALAFVVPLLLGVPVAFAVGLLGTLYVAVFGNIAFDTSALQTFYGIEVLSFMAIPLLILSGKLMEIAGLAQQLVDFAQVLVGRLRGGLGLADIVASLIFADISGSAVSDTAAIGSLLIPEMKRRGYRADFCAALQGASGTLGLMFPPAITLLIYATVINVSVSRLFAASILPGLLVALSFAVVVALHARRHRYPSEHVPPRLILPRVARAIPGLMAGVIVVGAILGGITTPAEAGIVLLLYVLLLSVTLYRRAGPRRLYRATLEAGHTSGMTLFLVATSALLGFVLARDLVPMWIAEMLSALTGNRYVILLILNVVFIATGILLEPGPVIVGFLPSVMPLLQQVGVDPIQWGVIFVVNAGIGMIHPPVGLTLNVSAAIAGVPFERTIIAALPFMAIMVVDLVLLSVLPHLSLLLPHMLYGYPIT